MSFDTAKTVIDWIFNNVPNNRDGIEVKFIGGEPLLEFELIKEIVLYTRSIAREYKYIFLQTRMKLY